MSPPARENVPPPNGTPNNRAIGSSALPYQRGIDGDQPHLSELLQQAIAEAEEADRDFLAMAAVATNEAAYMRVLSASDRARLALLLCDLAFARWRLALGRHVSEEL